MSLQTQFSRLARRDIRTTAEWYDLQRSGLGERWTDALDDTFDSIESNPLHFGLAVEADSIGIELREALFGAGRRITHRVLFGVDGDEIWVYAVRHVAQAEITEDDVRRH